MEKRQCWVEKQTNKALDDWRMDDVGLCLGFLAGDESAERGRRREKGRRRRKRKRRETLPTYNYVITSLKEDWTLRPCIYVNVNLFWFFPTSPSPLPTETTAAFLICPFQRVFKISRLQIPKRKKEKKERKKKKCIVSCRVVSLTLELGIVLNACRRYDEGKEKIIIKKRGGIFKNPIVSRS